MLNVYGLRKKWAKKWTLEWNIFHLLCFQKKAESFFSYLLDIDFSLPVHLTSFFSPFFIILYRMEGYLAWTSWNLYTIFDLISDNNKTHSIHDTVENYHWFLSWYKFRDILALFRKLMKLVTGTVSSSNLYGVLFLLLFLSLSSLTYELLWRSSSSTQGHTCDDDRKIYIHDLMRLNELMMLLRWKNGR